jgi:hypothetical protein
MAAIRPKNSSAASGAVSTRPMIVQDSDRDLDVSQSDADSDLWGSEATTSQGDQGDRSSHEEHAIARAETKAVRSLKLLVYLVLIVSAVAVSVGTSRPSFFAVSFSHCRRKTDFALATRVPSCVLLHVQQ